MKSGAPLKRYTELKAKQPMKRGEGPKRTAQPKPSRPKAVPKSVKAIIRTRAADSCEVGLVCGGRAAGVDPAHREGKGSGGTSKPWSNLASNLLWSCRACHDFIDQKQPARAEKLGLKVRAGVARPSEIPVLHDRFRWVLLDDEGGVRAAPADAVRECNLRGARPFPVIACTHWDLMLENGAFIEAMERFGHLQCAGWSPPRRGLFTCGCGSSPFVLDVVT